MFLVHLTSIVRVTIETGELAEIVGIGVARFTATPLPLMSTGKDREEQCVMVGEGRPFPRVIGVAQGAVGGEPRPSVFVVVVILVTCNAVVLARRGIDRPGHARAVATGAGEFSVAANQRIPTCEGSVIEVATVHP